MDLYERARTMFSQVSRDAEHDGHHGVERGYLSIRDGYGKFHYSKEDWMTEETPPEKLEALLLNLQRMDVYWAQRQEDKNNFPKGKIICPDSKSSLYCIK